MSFLGEIKRRKVFQVAAVYAVVAWLIIQIIDVVSEPLSLPGWIDTVVIVLLAVGFPIAVILAWAFDLTPSGVVRDRHDDSYPVQAAGQRFSYISQALVLLAVGFLVFDQYALGPRVSTDNTDRSTDAVNRFDYDLPEDQSFRWTGRRIMDLSLDGRQFVYNTVDGLYLRTMGELQARLVPGTEPILSSPTFAPDGQSVAYRTPESNQLKRVAISGGAPVVIADAVGILFGLSWETDGTIFFGQPEGILRVPANGGTPELIIEIEDGEAIYGPQLLPDGDSVLFSIASEGNWDDAQIVVHSLSTGERTVLIEGGNDARYLPTGHLIYTFGDGLFAVSFDSDSLTVSGGAVPLVQGLMRAAMRGTGAANYAISSDGTLVYVTGRALGLRSLVWVDRMGREDAISIEPSFYIYPRISPDGTRVVLDDRNEGSDLWVWDFSNETRIRLTAGSGAASDPAWTPDGARIAYDPDGTNDIDWKAANNTGRPESLATGLSNSGINTHDQYVFTPSGTELLFRSTRSLGTGNDIGMIEIGGDSEPVWLLEGPYNERNAEISPDGRWIAYQSDESQQYEIYVRPFPNVDDDLTLVSNAGGWKPLWSRDGGELFYLEPGPPERLMSVSVESAETTFSFSARTPILYWPYLGANGGSRTYDVSPDGQRFLAIKELDAGAATPQIIIVENWLEELNRLAPPLE